MESKDLMSLRGSNQGALAVDPVTDSLSKAQTCETAERVVDASVTARAVVAVALAGAGLWYVLWKLVVHFIAGH